MVIASFFADSYHVKRAEGVYAPELISSFKYFVYIYTLYGTNIADLPQTQKKMHAPTMILPFFRPMIFISGNNY